jgi:hypothetical protein
MDFYRNGKIIPVDVYADDTIEMVYYKLSESLGCSINDIYLFSSRHYDTLTSAEQFDMLSLPDYKGIPAFHLRNFYEGVNKYVRDVKGDQIYHEEDLDDLHGWIEFPIGQRVRSAADPSKATDVNLYHEPETEKSTLQRLLLDYMPFKNVYVCCKEDYPGMDGYFNHEPLDAVAMKSKNVPLLKLYSLVENYSPRDEGITRVVCRIDPVRPMVIPLDTLFNYLHVSDETPMIQYNTGNEDNIMYKILTKQVDLKGDKIPVVDERTVTKHDKSYKKSVTVFTQKRKKEDPSIKYGFMGDGSVMLEIKCMPSTIEQIDEAFLVYKNVLATVRDLMYKSGFTYPEFSSIRNGMIISMDMFAVFQVKGGARYCANPFFVGSGENTRYRRVSMFNESALIDELCIDYYERDMTEKIAPLIAQIMNISDADSLVMAEERISALNGLREKNPNKRFAVKDRVGFVSTVNHKNDEITMVITGITSIYYKESIQRNMKAYVAFQSNPSIQCEEPVKVDAVKPFNYRYEDSDTESESDGFELNDTSSESESDGFEIEDESDTDDELEGGANKNLDLIIKNESFLLTRIKQTFNPSEEYAKQCPIYRRPVVFKPGENTPEINEKFKNNILTHNNHTFVCTKYWDMKRKIPLNRGELGDQKVIKPNKMENHEVNFEVDGTIVEVQDRNTAKDFPFPGIVKNTLDAPCCFIKQQKNQPEKKKIAESKKYIVETTNSLNDPGQVGRLPKSLRYFFGLSIKDTHLLRYGIEKPHTFIQCLETVFQKAFASKTKTLKGQMEVWTKRGFDTYNNGNLKRQFKTIESFLKVMSKLDYTYLWEIVCDLFNVNLVIFRDPDGGNDLEVICPSNHYSTRSFDPTKKTLMVLEHKKAAFEPLVEHNIKTNTQTILHDFKTPHLHEGMKALAQIFWKCKTTTSVYIPNMIASVMYGKLNRPCVQVLQQGKCIGFSVDTVFIPCYPSALLPNVPVQDTIPVNTYKTIINKLNVFSKIVPCKPRFKVVENGTITGVVLETQAFVPCTHIKDYITDLHPYNSKIQYEYESIPEHEDDDRIRTTQRIKAEKCLYAACRRILKEILGKDAKLRNKINKLIRQKNVTENEVKSIMGSHIQFVDKTDESFIKTQVKCGGCCFAADKLILPKKNLVTGQPTQYFSRLADELNYYSRFSTFITSPQLLIPDVPFAVNDNELLLTTSTVKNYYATLMEAKRMPEYYTTFDNANPKPVPGRLTVLNVKKLGMITL